MAEWDTRWIEWAVHRGWVGAFVPGGVDLWIRPLQAGPFAILPLVILRALNPKWPRRRPYASLLLVASIGLGAVRMGLLSI